MTADDTSVGCAQAVKQITVTIYRSPEVHHAFPQFVASANDFAMQKIAKNALFTLGAPLFSSFFCR
jgi:hypothetical protein